LLLGMTGAAIASSAHAQGDPFGYEWEIREVSANGHFWTGTWRRRGGSNVWDAWWRDGATGGEVRDVIDLRGFDGRTVTLYRHGQRGTYVGELSPDGRHIRGTASWYEPGAFWTARIRG